MSASSRRRARPTARRRAAPLRPGPTGPIRRATEADLSLLVRHRRAMWEEIGGWTRRELAGADGPYRRWVRREMRARRFLGFLFLRPDRSVAGSGAVWIQPAQPRPGRLARREMPYILSMYTEPIARGRGVASALVREMVRWAERRGYRRIFLHASKRGRPVYARLGFVDGTEMRLDLPRAGRGRR